MDEHELIRMSEKMNAKVNAIGKGTRRMYAALATGTASLSLALLMGTNAHIACNGGVMADVRAKEISYGSFFLTVSVLTVIIELSLVLLYTFFGLAKLNSLGRTAEQNEDGTWVVRNLNWWAVEVGLHGLLVTMTCFGVLLFSIGIREGKKNEQTLNVRGEPCDLKCPAFTAAVVLAMGSLIPLFMLLKDAYGELVLMDMVGGCWGCRATPRRSMQNYYDESDDDVSEMIKYAGGGDGDAPPSPKKKAGSAPACFNAPSSATYKNDAYDAFNTVVKA